MLDSSTSDERTRTCTRPWDIHVTQVDAGPSSFSSLLPPPPPPPPPGHLAYWGRGAKEQMTVFLRALSNLPNPTDEEVVQRVIKGIAGVSCSYIVGCLGNLGRLGARRNYPSFSLQLPFLLAPTCFSRLLRSVRPEGLPSAHHGTSSGRSPDLTPACAVPFRRSVRRG